MTPDDLECIEEEAQRMRTGLDNFAFDIWQRAFARAIDVLEGNDVKTIVDTASTIADSAERAFRHRAEKHFAEVHARHVASHEKLGSKTHTHPSN